MIHSIEQLSSSVRIDGIALKERSAHEPKSRSGLIVELRLIAYLAAYQF